MNLHLVFVYGSLKRGQRHHGELAGARFVGPARAPGARLVRYVEGYPALVRTFGASVPESTVVGELFEVDDVLLAALDRFEDCPSLYQRALVDVVTERADANEVLPVYAYVIEAHVATAYPIIHGAWTSE